MPNYTKQYYETFKKTKYGLNDLILTILVTYSSNQNLNLCYF